MQFDMITPLLNKFDDLVSTLINDYKEFKLDEEAVVFLAKKTRNFIDFAKLTLMTVILKMLEQIKNSKHNFSNEIDEINKIIEHTFENMEKSLDTILAHDDEEEHEHSHSHDHEHHHHIDVESVQDDLKNIVDNLELLKKLVGKVGEIIVSYLKLENKEINEEEFETKLNSFKEDFESFKSNF